MASSRCFSWLLRVPVVVVGLGLLGLPFAGCGGDDDPSCPGGVLRDGKCYLNCDEAIDCKGDPKRKCVAYEEKGVSHPEGKCFSTCTAVTDCQGGEVCAGATTLKGEKASVCAPRSALKLPEGKAGDACTDNGGCDAASGLVCSSSKTCKLEGGRACTGATSCTDGFACFGGACVPAEGNPGEACGEGRGCVEGHVCFGGACVTEQGNPGESCGEGRQCVEGYACLDGVCMTEFANPGEACGGDRKCDAAKGLGCYEGRCLYTCKTLQGCAPGYACRALDAPAGDGSPGVCVKTDVPSGPGQYGTSCPKPEVCDKEAGFRCVGAKGDANAFCTKVDGCTKDDECPSGYWCGAITNSDSKGNINFDKPIRVCMQRDFCAPCQSDLDCSLVTGAICVPDADGEKHCSLPCSPESNSCLIGAACVDAGGRFACRPDTGSCHPKGDPTGCDACRIDSDCGPKALCRAGAIGNKTGVKWCQVPCGAPDKDGKRPCPVAPSGAEMICLDENEFSIGGPFTSAENPNSVYGMCFRPLTVDNTVESDKDPPIGACGNARREGSEECDDGNPFSSDGCNKSCKITEECRFTLDDADAEGKALLRQGDKTFDVVPLACRSFAIEGTLKQAGEADTFFFDLPEGTSSWFEVFTGKIGTCSADLMAAVHTGTYDAETGVLDVDSDPKTPGVQLAACDKLSSTIKNLDASSPSLCKEGSFLGCGSCSQNGLCGTCDDDGGIGNCPRMLVSSTLSYSGYEVKFAAVRRMGRVYARDAKASGIAYTAVVDRLTAGSQGPKNPPTLSCY